MQVETQNQNTVIAQNRGYWGYEEIEVSQLKKVAGAGDSGCGSNDSGCGANYGGCGSTNNGSVPGDGVSSQGTPSAGSGYNGVGSSTSTTGPLAGSEWGSQQNTISTQQAMGIANQIGAFTAGGRTNGSDVVAAGIESIQNFINGSN